MVQSLTHRVIAVLCLLAFCVGQSVFGTLGVWCEHPSGRSTLEFACVKTGDGSCASVCRSTGDETPATEHAQSPCEEDGEHSPHPCNDTPVGGSGKALPKLGTGRCTHLITTLPSLAQLIVFGDPPPFHATSQARASMRPPDAVARLRTIIMTV